MGYNIYKMLINFLLIFHAINFDVNQIFYKEF